MVLAEGMRWDEIMLLTVVSDGVVLLVAGVDDVWLVCRDGDRLGGDVWDVLGGCLVDGLAGLAGDAVLLWLVVAMLVLGTFSWEGSCHAGSGEDGGDELHLADCMCLSAGNKEERLYERMCGYGSKSQRLKRRLYILYLLLLLHEDSSLGLCVQWILLLSS